MAENQKMKLGTLTAMVVGGMVGAVCFRYPEISRKPLASTAR